MTTRQSQTDRLLDLLRRPEAFSDGWVPLPRIIELGIASHTRRISDLRKKGFMIECEREYVANGQFHSRYRLKMLDAE